MPLTPNEKKELNWWSFIAAYKRYRKDFDYLAQIIYVNNCPEWAGRQHEAKKMFEEFLGIAVQAHGRWHDMQKEGKKSQMPPAVYTSFAPAFGKHIAEQNQHLLQAPCP